MAETIVMIGVGSLLVAQYLAALVIYFDAERLGIENPSHYSMGVYLPLGGLLVIPVYVSRRRDLVPDSETPTADHE